MKVGITKDEMWPVYQIVPVTQENMGWVEKIIEVPDDLIAREHKAYRAFAGIQNEIEALYKESP